MPGGFFVYTKEEFEEYFRLIQEYKDHHEKYLAYVFRWKQLADIIAAFVLAVLLDGLIVRTILGGSVLKFIATIWFAYGIAGFLLSGNILSVGMILKYSQYKSLKAKVVLNSICSMLYDSFIAAALVVLFVLALRANYIDIAGLLEYKYNVPLDTLQSLFKHVPFVVFHYFAVAQA